MSKDKIDSLVKEIRICRECESKPGQFKGKMPFVFSGSSPLFMVVSEEPPSTAWNSNMGEEYWGKGDIFGKNGGIPGELCNWLKIEKANFQNWAFWIQRRNCWNDSQKDRMMLGCSNRYLRRAIRELDPEIVILLGTLASDFFSMSGLVKERIDSRFQNPDMEIEGRIRQVYVLYHPSWRTKKIRQNSRNYEVAEHIGKQIQGIASPIG